MEIWDKQVVAATLLAVIPQVEDQLRLSREFTCKHAMYSFHEKDTQGICEMIIDRTAREDNLHNLRTKIRRLFESWRISDDNGCSAAMLLHYFAGKSNIDAAKILGVTAATVSRNLREGRNRFAEELSKVGINRFSFRQLLSQWHWIFAIYCKITDSV